MSFKRGNDHARPKSRSRFTLERWHRWLERMGKPEPPGTERLKVGIERFKEALAAKEPKL